TVVEISDRSRLMTLPLADLLRMLLGDAWRSRAGRVFRRSPRTIQRWCSGETPLPIWATRRIERLILERMPIGKWQQARYQEIDAEARERTGLAGNALAACKLLRGQRAGERPRVGRPRKRELGPAPLIPARVPETSVPEIAPTAFRLFPTVRG